MSRRILHFLLIATVATASSLAGVTPGRLGASEAASGPARTSKSRCCLVSSDARCCTRACCAAAPEKTPPAPSSTSPSRASVPDLLVETQAGQEVAIETPSRTRVATRLDAEVQSDAPSLQASQVRLQI